MTQCIRWVVVIAGLSAMAVGCQRNGQTTVVPVQSEPGQTQATQPQAAQASTAVPTMTSTVAIVKPVAQEEFGLAWTNLQNNNIVDLRTGMLSNTLTLTGQITVPAGVQVLAMAPRPQIDVAEDERGRSLVEYAESSRAESGLRRPDIAASFSNVAVAPILGPNWNFNNYHNQAQNVNLSFRNLNPMPRQFKRLAGSVTLLAAGETQAVELVAEDMTGGYIQVTPGLKAMLQLSTRDGGRGEAGTPTSYTLLFDNGQDNNQSHWQRVIVTPPAVLAMEFLDAAGRALPGRNPQRDASSDGGGYRGRLQGQVIVPTGQAISKVRLTVLLSVNQVTLPFDLKDVPLP
jgi:hypothetical protein